MRSGSAGEPPIRSAGPAAAAEERYRAIFDHVPDAILVLDLDTRRFEEANEGACRLLGYSQEEFVGLHLSALRTDSLPGEDAAELANRSFEAVLRGESPVFEIAFKHRDGSHIDTELRLVRMPPLDRRLVVGILRDIRERKAAQRDLATREAQFRALAENSPDSIVRFDRDLRRAYLNRAVATAAGRRAEDLLGRTPSESFPGSPVMEDFERALRRVFSSGLPEVFEGAPGVAGRTWVQTSMVPEFDEHGEVASVLAITRDLSSTRRALEAETRLASIVEWADDAIVSTGLDGRILSWNRAAERMFGYPASEAIGRDTEFLFGPRSNERAALRGRVLAGETVAGVEADWRRADGTAVTTSSVFFPLRDAAGNVTGVASIARDISEERRASRELAESERRLRVAFRTARMGSWSYSFETGVVTYSQELADLYARPLDAMPRTMREAIDIIHPEDRETMVRRLREGEGLDQDVREYRVSMPDGSYRWFAGVGGMTIGSDGHVSGVVMDVHERKLAEEALRQSETRFRQVVESVSAGIWLWDGERILQVNRALERMLGYHRDQLLVPGFFESHIHPDDIAAMRTISSAVEAGESRIPPPIEVRVTAADGSLRHLELNAAQIRLNDRNVWLASVFDVTERQQVLDALRDSEARFRSLVDNSPDYITRIDRDLRHDFVNATAQTEAGLDPEKVLGKRADEIGFDPDVARLFMARQQQVFETGERVEYEYTVRSLASPEVVSHRRARVIPEFDASGNVHHVLSIVTDITGQRKAEEERKRLDLQIQQAQKLESLGVLAGGIAHDFNNLLVAILGNAGLALMELPPESPARQTIQDIETAAQRASELTRQMLAYSGKGRFVIEPLNLSRVVEEMAHLLEVSVSRRAVLHYDFAPALPAIEADATQIRQVIMNLIINASDALGDAPGAISISTGLVSADRAYLASAYVDEDLPEGDYVYVEVADTGSGMDSETRARIFDPFFTTKFTGRGLGLAAVLGIVRGHRGAINLTSELGHGTTFRVLFPVTGDGGASAPEPAAGAAEPRAAGHTLLVVDDDDTVRLVTKRILEHAGFHVLSAADGREGVETYAQNRQQVALVLLDMTMPNMDGAEAFRELRAIDPGVRVLLTSGYNEQDATERFTGEGLAGFIQKPYRPQELLDKIHEALGGQAPSGSARTVTPDA